MITLTIEAITPIDAIANRHSWPVRVTAVSDDPELSSKVFVYHATADDVLPDMFECVASLMQMTELPEDAPTTEIPYYRKDVAEVNARSAEHASEYIQIIKDDVQDLLDNYNQSARLSVIETVELH